MDIQKGNLLVAEPFMLDDNFKRSVILICEHEEHGTTGFALNKPFHVSMEQLITGFPKCDAPVFYGGPVGIDSIHYLHNVGDILDGSLEVCKGVFWGGDFEKLKFLIENQLIQSHNIRFYVGYSGWSEGQLVEELHGNSWVVTEMDSNYLFKTKPIILWQTVLQNMGDRYTVIAQISDDPQYN
ncbi:MAG: YqgE/AlgH family protein [Saprospiraceae bacterium]